MRESSGPQPSRLKEFQQRLSQRMQQASREHASGQACIAVSTGKRRWLFDLAYTAEIIAPIALTPVPFTCDWYLGLINHRNQLTSVINLDVFAGVSGARWQAGDRLLVLSPALPLRCAIRVEQMHGVMDRSRLQPVARDAVQADWCTQSFNDADGLQWEQVDLPELMKSPAFLDITRR